MPNLQRDGTSVCTFGIKRKDFLRQAQLPIDVCLSVCVWAESKHRRIGTETYGQTLTNRTAGWQADLP